MLGLRRRAKIYKRPKSSMTNNQLCEPILQVRTILARELKQRHFGKKLPEAVRILLALSLQHTDPLKRVFRDDDARQSEAAASLTAAYRTLKPREPPKSQPSPKKHKRASSGAHAALLGSDSESDDKANDADSGGDFGASAADDETELFFWRSLTDDANATVLAKHTSKSGYVHHLSLVSEFKEKAAVICRLYESYGPALLHEANSERSFSDAKKFQDMLLHVSPELLSLLVFINGYLHIYKPTAAEVKAEYERLYRKKPNSAAAASAAHSTMTGEADDEHAKSELTGIDSSSSDESSGSDSEDGDDDSDGDDKDSDGGGGDSGAHGDGARASSARA